MDGRDTSVAGQISVTRARIASTSTSAPRRASPGFTPTLTTVSQSRRLRGRTSSSSWYGLFYLHEKDLTQYRHYSQTCLCTRRRRCSSWTRMGIVSLQNIIGQPTRRWQNQKAWLPSRNRRRLKKGYGRKPGKPEVRRVPMYTRAFGLIQSQYQETSFCTKAD